MTEPVRPRVPERTAQQAAMVEAFGGKRGLVDSGLPAVVFVFVNSVVDAFAEKDTALTGALVAAVATGLAVIGLRLRRKESIQQAVSGFLGLAIAVFFAARSGEARDFFLPGILINVAYGAAFVLSALIGRPIIGFIVSAVEGLGQRWRTEPRLRRAFGLMSIGWGVGVFGLRAAVQGALYAADRPGLLAAARLLMGWPLTILGVVLTLVWVRRLHLHDDAEPAAEPEPVTAVED